MTFGDDIFYYIIKTLLVVLGIMGMMASCTKIKYSYKKCAVVLVLYLIWVAAVSLAILRFFGFLIFLRLCFFLISIPATLILYFILDYSPWQAVFHYAMQLSIALVLAISQTLLVTLFGGGRFMDFFIRLFSFAFCIGIDRTFVRKNFEKFNYLPDKNWRILSVVPLGFIFLLFTIALYPIHYTQSAVSIIYIYSITVIMLLVYVIIFHTLITQHKLQSAEHTNSILVSQLRSIEKQLDTINETDEQLRMYRHDMRFYMANIKGLLSVGDVEGALEFIGGVDNRLAESKYKIYCRDKMINAVLSYYIDKAEENGIGTKISFVLPDKFAIDKVDFTVMLSNALDNAINACMKIENQSERMLCIKTRNINQYMIEIANTFNGVIEFDDNGLPKTSERGHGMGTRSIAVFAERNGALLDYSVDGKWFRLRIISM